MDVVYWTNKNWCTSAQFECFLIIVFTVHAHSLELRCSIKKRNIRVDNIELGLEYVGDQCSHLVDKVILIIFFLYAINVKLRSQTEMKIWKDTCPAKEEKLFPALSILPLVTLHVPFHIITYALNTFIAWTIFLKAGLLHMPLYTILYNNLRLVATLCLTVCMIMHSTFIVICALFCDLLTSFTEHSSVHTEEVIPLNT